jgi:photosystem II stability/assembly factor-like uncharacterized protein
MFSARLWPVLTAVVLFFASAPESGQSTRSASPQENNADHQTIVWQPIKVETKASLRGLCVHNDQVVWASGTNGTVIRSYDQGQTWRIEQIAGAEKLDFRDLHVIDADTVVAMTSGTPARIYRTDDRGESWSAVYESIDPKVFLDSLSFLDQNLGLVMGDPIDGTLFLLKTVDGGKTWSRVEGTPRLEPGEAGFAASGTNMITWGRDRVYIALGGGEPQAQPVISRILITDSNLRNWRTVSTPIPRHESGGIFSILMIDAQHGVAVGGDYKQPSLAKNHFAFTTDGGQTWNLPDAATQDALKGIATSPSGYRSCVTAYRRSGGEIGLLAVGPEGTDSSHDLGKTWINISAEGFHATQFAPGGRVGFAVGSEGRVSRWQGN